MNKKKWYLKPISITTDRPSLVKSAWFYGGISPSFHIELVNNGQINIHLPKKFTLIKTNQPQKKKGGER